MGHFGDSQLKTAWYLEKDEQKYCKDCNQQISDKDHLVNKGLCDDCKEEDK